MTNIIDILMDGDYQPQNRWELIFNDMPSVGFHVTETNIPFLKLGKDKTPQGQVLPGEVENFGDITLTFRETVKFSQLGYFLAWQDQVFDRTNMLFKTNVPDNIKRKQAIINFYNPFTQIPLITNESRGIEASSSTSFATVPTFTAIFKDLELQGIDEISLSKEDGEPLSFTCTMSVSTITYDTPNAKLPPSVLISTGTSLIS